MTETELETSRTSITGKSAAHAVGIALVGVLVLTIIYWLMSVALRYSETGQLHLGFSYFIGLFKFVGVCAGPILFILAFALLQRVRLPW